jgi:phage terminase small subunit
MAKLHRGNGSSDMTRGRKPKLPHLRLVDGTHRADRHGDAGDARKSVEQSAAAFGKPTRPKYFKGYALEAWKRFIEPAAWLDASREPSAIVFCELWQEFRRAPANFPAAKHTQLRGYSADLGLTDDRKRAVAAPAELPDEHFDE